jgi:hypothetical protein
MWSLLREAVAAGMADYDNANDRADFAIAAVEGFPENGDQSCNAQD